MTNKPITCLACGVLRMEIEALAVRGLLGCNLISLESMLHMRPAKLQQEMERVMTANPEQDFVILYGDCHPRMQEMQDRNNASKVTGINCCELLLGREVYRKLQKEQVFIFLPEWTLRWKEVFTRELGFDKQEVAQAFMREYRSRLVYVDSGVMPVPDAALREISIFFGMPVEVMPVSLDILLQGVNAALLKFTTDDQACG